jgi:hypothetical protein
MYQENKEYYASEGNIEFDMKPTKRKREATSFMSSSSSSSFLSSSLNLSPPSSSLSSSSSSLSSSFSSSLSSSSSSSLSISYSLPSSNTYKKKGVKIKKSTNKKIEGEENEENNDNYKTEGESEKEKGMPRLRRRKSYQTKGVYNEKIMGISKETVAIEHIPKKTYSKKKDWKNNYNNEEELGVVVDSNKFPPVQFFNSPAEQLLNNIKEK